MPHRVEPKQVPMIAAAPELREELTTLYPALAGVPAGELDRLLEAARVVVLPAGAALFGAGSPCRHFPFVLAGSIRVSKVGEDRELRLYRVGPGESCVLTSSCLVGGSDYPASGRVEAETRLLVLAREGFERLMATHPPFRQYVFGLFAERMAELMALVEAVAFHRLDRRVAAALLGRGPVLRLTHRELADEVGSVREIVTRVLNGYAEEGLLRLGRGSIEILDAAALRRIATGREPA